MPLECLQGSYGKLRREQETVNVKALLNSTTLETEQSSTEEAEQLTRMLRSETCTLRLSNCEV